jgi:hypothetical protein
MHAFLSFSTSITGLPGAKTRLQRPPRACTTQPLVAE